MSPDPNDTTKPDPTPEDHPEKLPLPGSPSADAESSDETAKKNDSDPTEGKAGGDPSPATNPKDPDRSGKPGVTSAFESLLKNPKETLSQLEGKPGFRTAIQLAIAAFACLLGFGFVVGTMSGGEQLWAAPIKVALGVLASALICYPSLYIFSCLTGLDLRPGLLAGLLAACVCLTALLLVGFAPVAWLFAQSTDSTIFFGILCLAIWATALYFGLGLFRHIADHFGVTKRHHLYVWAGIFALVTVQMSTSLRPIVGTAPTFLPQEKKFFLEHWFGEIDEAGRRATGIIPNASAHRIDGGNDRGKIEGKDGWE